MERFRQHVHARRRALAGACLALIAGCATKPAIEDQGRLASACQLMKCTCQQPEQSIFRKPETRPVQWRSNGAAYCPEGFVLQRPDPDAKPSGY
jgi:hypothetical protein